MIYGYIRVSTDKQDCANQKLGIEAKAAKLGICIDKYIEDSGISGTKEPEERALGGIMQRTVASWAKNVHDYANFGTLYENWRTPVHGQRWV